MQDIISDLFYGNIHANEKTYKEGTEAARLSQAFSESEDWLTEHLTGENKANLLDLLNTRSELDGLLSYEYFRKGFILGARFIMEVCYAQDDGTED